MKEYKVVTMNTPEEAEAEMNARARGLLYSHLL